MKVYPITRPKKCFQWNKILSVDYESCGYNEKTEIYDRYHSLNLYLGIFVFFFDIKIMTLSILLNELVHMNNNNNYLYFLIIGIHVLSVMKLVLYISNNLIERKEDSLLVNMNSKKLFTKHTHIFFYFYIVLSLINHVPIDEASSIYEISVYVESIDYYYAYNIHDFFTLICIVRIFGSVLFVFNYFSLSQTKYRRIIAHTGIENYNRFAFKYFFSTRPFLFSFSFLFLFILASTFMIRIIERSNPFNNFEIVYNSIYFITTTITTLGYGDYTPLSSLGRMLSFVIMVIGLVNVNLINYAMINYVRMTPKEEKALDTLIKMELKEKLAKQYFSLFFYIRRNNKLLTYSESFVSKFLWKFYICRVYHYYRKLRNNRIKYEKMNFFMASDKNGSLKKNLGIKFSIFSSNLDDIKRSTIEINKDLFSYKPEDVSISSKIYELLQIDAI